MTERREAARRSARAPLPPRSRKRWAVAAGVVVCWAALLDLTGSIFAATLLLALFAGLGIIAVLSLRALGVTRDHPWIQRLAARPWRDGQDVLKLALRHLHDVLVITPSGTLLAPNVVDLRLNPADLHSITERMDLGLVSTSAAEVYAEQVAAQGARFAGPGPAEVRVIADPSVAPGRYLLRQGEPVYAGAPAYAAPPSGYAAAQPAYAVPQPSPSGPAGAGGGAPGTGVGSPGAGAGAPGAGAGPPAAGHPGPRPVPAGPYPGFVGHDGNTRAQRGEGGEPEPERSATTGMLTVAEASRGPVPTLRLVTEGKVAHTRTSGARAGRGSVELKLPGVPTISREHARFTFSDGRWWIANLGRNGLSLNGAPLVGEKPLSNGDSIRWGSRSDALLTWVEIS